MASKTTSQRSGQVNSRMRNASSQMYVYGNAVPKPDARPQRWGEDPKRQSKVSRQVRRNRNKAMHMSPGYVIFLAAAAILALIVCVNYVQLQSRITSRSKNITAMQQELSSMKEENTTKYNAIMDSVNLDEIRDKAQLELGMIYASSEQIVEYDNPASDYVKKYENIPADGVLAQSDKKK